MKRVKPSYKTIVLAALLVLTVPAGLMAGPLDAFKGEKGTIKISGGTAHIPVMKEAAKKIMTANPAIQISIAGGGSGVGITQVGEGLVDIGNSGRKPKDEEIARYNLEMFEWAIDGVAVVVNPANKVGALTKAQIKDIFSGKITNWSQVGGIDKAINVYTRDEASGTREVFGEKALDKGTITGKAAVVVSNGAMKSAVTSDPYAIGYVSVGHMDKGTKAVAMDGVIPSTETVKSKKYPVARGLYSNTKGKPAGLVKKFIDYLMSPEGQSLAVANGFIPVK
jgi:phosphate transport system substrate-binding protein